MPLPAFPRLGFIGAGRLARCLATAFARAGYPVVAVTSRSQDSAARLACGLPLCRAVADAQEVADCSDLVFLAVPDDSIGTIAKILKFETRQGRPAALVHCSGATSVDVLAPARTQGVSIGGFHPLYLFRGDEADLQHIAGCTVTIEAQEELAPVLEALAHALGCAVLTLGGAQRMLYHGAAHYAASFALAGLAEAVGIWRALGFDEQQSLRALLPMLAGTAEAARAKGLAGALAGPVSRGDAGVLERQLAAFETLGGDHAVLYALLTRRALSLARSRTHPPTTIDTMSDLVEATLERMRSPNAGSS